MDPHPGRAWLFRLACLDRRAFPQVKVSDDGLDNNGFFYVVCVAVATLTMLKTIATPVETTRLAPRMRSLTKIWASKPLGTGRIGESRRQEPRCRHRRVDTSIAR